MESNKGRTIKSDAREIIANVINMCELEAQNNSLKLPLIAKTQRAAAYTGVSQATIKRIKNEDRKRKAENPEKKLLSPGTKRSRLKSEEKLDDFDFQVIRREIEDFYLVKKVVPTVASLLAAVHSKIDFPLSSFTLNKLLRAKGFCWRKCQNKKKVLMERPEIIHWRLTYLRAIKKYQNQQKLIIYLDEMSIENDMTVKKCWENDNELGFKSGVHSSGRLIVVHAGSIHGFIKKAEPDVFRKEMMTGNYNVYVNKNNFEKWFLEHLFPTIPPGCVIVLVDNHSEEINKLPTKSSTKKTMLEWLTKNKIEHDANLRKADLFELIQKFVAGQPKEKKYKVDQVIKENGHIPLRPPYMCELNPMPGLMLNVIFDTALLLGNFQLNN